MRAVLLTTLLILPFFLFAQSTVTKDYTGAWDYEVLDTPSGDYFGELILSKKNGQYQGVIYTQDGDTSSNTNFKKVQPLMENLWEIDETIKYNPEFWDNFTIVEANNE